MQPTPFHPPGTLIANRYEVASRPMVGGMGIVYICLDHQEDRPVALKTFKPEYLPDRAARDRFLREGTAWVALGAYPHVVRCYEVILPDVSLEVYLVLELIAKEQGYPDASLRSWLLPRQPLPVEPALLFALQIVRGMQHAVECLPGFVHRDLKPENVLVGTDKLPGTNVNQLRVTDFGLAAVLQGAESEVQPAPASSIQYPASNNQQSVTRTQLTHGMVGTPLYMAPEQWQGEKLGVYTDVYALGCMLVEMLTGERAVALDSLTALRHAHCTGEVRPLPIDLPDSVHELVARCVALDPGGRYPDWDTVGAALVAVLETITGHPVPPSAPVAVLSRADQVAHGWSHNAMGLSYLDLGKVEVAVDYFKRAETVGTDAREPALRGSALGNLGTAYAQLGEVRRAIGYFEQRIAIAREIGDRRGEGNALMGLGNAYQHLGEVRRAIGYYEQCLVIVREIGDRQGVGITLNNLGIAYANLGEVWRAIDYFEQALEMARETDDRHEEGTALNNLGKAYQDLGEVRRAIGYLEQALEVAREIGDRRGEGNALGNLGNVCQDLGEVQRAIGYLEQALEVAREIGNRCGEGNALGDLGVTYANLGEGQRAISYFEQQLVIAREIGDRRGEGTALDNLGVVYKNFGGMRRAIGYYEQCLVIVREIGDRRWEGAALNHLGVAHKNIGEVQQAIGYYEQAIKISQEMGDVLTTAMFSANLASALAQVGEFGKAIQLLEQAICDFQQGGYPQQAQQAQQMLEKLQEGSTSAGDPEANAVQQAFEAFRRAESLEAMQRTVARFPLMIDPRFVEAVEQIITQRMPSELRPAFEQRLAWLRESARK